MSTNHFHPSQIMNQNERRGARIGRYLEADVLLGLGSIPFTLVLTTDPSKVQIAPVFVAAVVAGVYYGPRSRPAGRAGFRTGLVGGLPMVLPTVDIYVSELPGGSEHFTIVVLGGVAWICLAFAFVTVGSSLCAKFGGWLSRRLAE